LNGKGDYLQYIIRLILKLYKEFSAQCKGQSFYCNALSGHSTYNISINSDMSVSCNCQDYDGQGQIGILAADSFEKIFSSEKANQFRTELSRGKLPILICSRCSELRVIPKVKAGYFVTHYKIPDGGIMLENTINCNLNCRACLRKKVEKKRRKKNLSLDDVKKVSLLIKKHGIRSLAFFNLGEPFLSRTIYEEVRMIREMNPSLTIIASTNGYFMDTDAKREAALLMDHVLFSIDGISNEVLAKYQRNGSFDRSFENLKKLVQYRAEKGRRSPVIEWKYVLFNWNDKPEYISQAVAMAENAGVDVLSFCPTMNPVYGISWRYYCGHFFKKVGVKSWKGREIVFRKE
jgi:uncharacterized Fe-S cluster-containing radical SAM superfamily protein